MPVSALTCSDTLKSRSAAEDVSQVDIRLLICKRIIQKMFFSLMEKSIMKLGFLHCPS